MLLAGGFGGSEEDMKKNSVVWGFSCEFCLEDFDIKVKFLPISFSQDIIIFKAGGRT